MATEEQPVDGVLQGQTQLREAIQQYEDLLDRALGKLSSRQDQQSARAVLDRLKAADKALSSLSPDTRVPIPAKLPAGTTPSETASNPTSPWPGLPRAERYLGEPSDVRFFNLVKQVLQTQLGSDNPDHGVASYEQEGDIASTTVIPEKIVQLPSLDVAKAFANVYFTTVHLAFPFIQQTSYMQWLYQALGLSDDNALDTTQLAIICKGNV